MIFRDYTINFSKRDPSSLLPTPFHMTFVVLHAATFRNSGTFNSQVKKFVDIRFAIYSALFQSRKVKGQTLASKFSNFEVF